MEVIKQGRINLTEEDFGTPDNEIIISLSGASLIEQMIELSQPMQAAASQSGYSEDANQALFLFISEVSNNALKARGSYELIKTYGTFENLINAYENPREIINETVTQSYPSTEVRVKWLLGSRFIRLEISNNTPLDEYFECRIKQALNKSPIITEELIEKLSHTDNILDTRASGIGMGLSMAVNFAEFAGGSVGYNTNTPGWTTFWLELKI